MLSMMLHVYMLIQKAGNAWPEILGGAVAFYMHEVYHRLYHSLQRNAQKGVMRLLRRRSWMARP